MLHSVASLIPFLCHNTLGEFITIPNQGFEADGSVPVNTYYYGGKIISDWTLYDPQKLDDDSTGIQNPTGGSAFNDPTFNDGTPEGSISAYVEQVDDKSIDSGEIGIEQTITGYSITADTTYILTVYIGNTNNNCWSKDSTDGKENCYDRPGFPGYRVQILGGNTILAEDDNSLSILEGQWLKSTVTVTISSGNNNIGSDLTIRLINKNVSDGIEVAFDDVKLELLTTTETISPTRSPTPSPTKQPTPSPTTQPTPSPTLNPTKYPSLSPNNDPIPSPTYIPSNLPSDSPMFVPTKGPQTYVSMLDETTANPETLMSTEGIGAGVEGTDGNVLSGVQLLAVAVSVLLLLCFLCCAVLFIVYKIRETKSDRENEDHIEMLSESEDQDPKAKSARKAKDQLTVKSFFEFDLSLPQYYASFIDHGYDSLRAIMMIKSKDDLIPLGITLPGHQSLILSKVKMLREVTEGGIGDGTDPTTHLQTGVKQEEDGMDMGKEMEMEIDQEMEKDRKMIKAWLDYNVGLPKYKYHELFIDSGYESMKAIQAIRGKAQLKEIGVKVLGHQTLILSEIEKLNQNVNNQYNVDIMRDSEMQQLPALPVQQNVVPVEEGDMDVSDDVNYGFAPPGQGYEIQQMLDKQNLRMQEMQNSMAEADAKIRSLEETVGK